MLDKPKLPPQLEPPPPEKRCAYWQMATCGNSECMCIHLVLYNFKDEFIASMTVDREWMANAAVVLDDLEEERKGSLQ